MELCKDNVAAVVLSRDNNGVTPLHIAAKQQSARMLKVRTGILVLRKCNGL